MFFALALFSTPSFADSVIPEVSAPAVQVDARAHLASQRRIQIERLRAYANAGVFPINTTQPGLLSQLLDGQGRPCAMAHLIRESGHGALIDAWSARNNAVELGSLRSGPVHEWILDSGLTHEEVAYIQEPDFFMEQDLATLQPVQPDLAELERERLRLHFLTAAAQLEQNFEAGVTAALKAATS